MICISLSASTNREMAALLAQAANEPGDLHELQLDSLTEPPEVELLVHSSTRPVVVACRSREACGLFDGTAAERRNILLRAARAGAGYVKAEPADVNFLAEKVRPAVLIAVLVDSGGTPPALFRQVGGLASLPADWVGFSTAHRKMMDSITVLEAIAACPKPCFGEATGEGGLVTRVLGLAYGARFVRADPESGSRSSSRPAARDLAGVYRVKELTKDTPVYGLLGGRVAHSHSFLLHNAAFRELDLDAVHIPFQSGSAEDFFSIMPGAVNLRGLSVTMPHQQAALRWAEQANGFVKRIGAANLLTLTERGWYANNTSCSAAFESLEQFISSAGMNLTGAHALVLGAGGTARSVGLALTLLGCRVTVAARNIDKAWDVAGQSGWEAEEWEEAPFGNWELVANATPVGMCPDSDATPFPAECWRPEMIAFDAVYNPRETRFLRDAAAAGCIAVDGMDMYIRHVARQFKNWTGLDMPASVLSARRILP